MKINKGLLLSCAVLMTGNTHANPLKICSNLFFEGYAPIISNQKLNKNLHPLCFSAFAVNFSGVSKTALWSAEYTTPESLRKAKGVKREDEFHEEPRLDDKTASKLTDYRGSGYDRGHLSPAGGMPSKLDMYQSFSLANIAPQSQKNNQESWRNVEEAVRTLITKRQEPAYVITGGLFLSPTVVKIGSGVLVPSHMYKVVFFPKSQIMSGYVSVNDDRGITDVVSVAQLQQKSGLVFFPTLNGSVLMRKRYALPLSANAAYKMPGFSLKGGESGIFEQMPDPNARPAVVKKGNAKQNVKKEMQKQIKRSTQKLSEKALKSVVNVVG